MEDERILELFFARSELAIHALDEKYGKLCYRLSYNILNSRPDAEECVNDAYLNTWNAIPPKRPKPLSAFVCKIVHNLSVSRRRVNTAVKRNSAYDIAMDEMETCIAAPSRVEEGIEARELAGLIENFLDTLTPENRRIFLRRYWFFDSYAEIAGQLGLPEKTVSMRLTRTRRLLRDFLTEKGVLS